MPAGRFDDGPAEGRAPGEARVIRAGNRTIRAVASAPLLRLGWGLVHAGWSVSPPEEKVDAVARLTGVPVDTQAREIVVTTLEGDLDGLLDDAAARGISDRATDALLTIVGILAWLRDGAEPPGWAAMEELEVGVALFNDAHKDEEKEIRQAFLDVLLLLLGDRVMALREGSLRRRRINIESAEGSEARRFGAALEDARASREMTVGELAENSTLDLVTVIGLLRGARSVNSAEILLLADALQVDPAALLPDRPGAANPAVASRAPGQGPDAGGDR
jgi:hypothetical protein